MQDAGMTESSVDLSVVVPCYNEEENIGPLVRELVEVLTPLGKSFEILFVDDCSTDRTVARVWEIRAEFPAVRLVRHTNNWGQSAAISTGFQMARGAILVTLDADLQNDPHDIPILLEYLSNADLVCGIRARRKDPWIRRLSSRIGNAFRNLITGDSIVDTGCSLRVLKREVVHELPRFNGLHRFLPTLARFQGFRVVEVPVNHRPRQFGKSKYGIGNRLWRGILDCLAVRWFKYRLFSSERTQKSHEE